MKELILTCTLTILACASQQKLTSQDSPLDVVTPIKPIQSIIAGYLHVHDQESNS